MTTTRNNPIVRVLPSLTDLAFIMPIILLFAGDGAKKMLGDGDTGWHIRTGEWILANRRVPTTDMFSFTKAGETWYAWEWLWDACFAWIYHHGGLASVIAASVLIICVSFALLFRLVRRHCGNPFIAMAATFLACGASAIHWLARPHLVTFLFLILLLSVIDRVNEGRVRFLFFLPPMTILWTNLHGGFFIEFVVLAGVIAGQIARALFTADSSERSAALRLGKWYLGTGLACAAATLVNPYTYHLHAHIYQFFSEPYHVQNINEYQSISFHSPASLFFESLILLGIISAIWFVVNRRDFVPFILVAGWAHLALFSARNIPLFALIAAPVIGQALNEMLERLKQAPAAAWLHRAATRFQDGAAEFGETDRLWRFHLPSAAAIVLIAVLMLNPAATGKLKPEYDPRQYPAKALGVLRENPSARIFADDEWGDYLVYHLCPRQKVFIDGRDDFYGQDFEQKYFDVMGAKYDWEQYFRTYQIDTIILSPKAALSTVIKESRNWRVIYDDTVAIVFRAVPSKAPPGQQVFTAVPGEKNRDPRITKVVQSDSRIAKSKKGV